MKLTVATVVKLNEALIASYMEILETVDKIQREVSQNQSHRLYETRLCTVPLNNFTKQYISMCLNLSLPKLTGKYVSGDIF